MRSAPVLEEAALLELFEHVPEDAEVILKTPLAEVG
jgi:hypothetical protein